MFHAVLFPSMNAMMNATSRNFGIESGVEFLALLKAFKEILY